MKHGAMSWNRTLLGVVGLLLISIGAAACSGDTKTVFVERPLFDPPEDVALGFLGYGFTEEAELTVCGNCHVGMQGEWTHTAHADAWNGLQSSGGAQAFCEGCHTANNNGNSADGEAGWLTTGDPRYYDVQCENCHGAGETHVANPDAAQPLASLRVSEDTGCGECHAGTHHPFVEQWAESKHASVVGFAAGREECAGCHRGQGALLAWGINSDYEEADAAEHLAITCGVCHDPHSDHNAGQLRFPVETPSYEAHLCAKCHDRRTEPDPNSSHGLAPHAPETALLQGVAGWFPPDGELEQGRIIASHGSERNTKLCATCHVDSFTVTDPQGGFVFSSVGHRFESIPCVDSQGIPIDGPCELSTTARTFNGCTGSGIGTTCHSEEGARSALETVANRNVNIWMTQLRGQLQMVPAGEIDTSDPTFTVAEGALFNYNLAQFPAEGFEDAPVAENVWGTTTHNPFLIEALLIASIDAVEARYGISPSVQLDLKQELRDVLRRLGQ